MRYLGFALVIGCVVLTGCASDKMIVDTKGMNKRQYQEDLRECEVYADQVNVAGKVAGEAAVAAAVGGVIGAVVGNSKSAEKLAGVGAVAGGTGGAQGAILERKQIVRKCLRGRGYRVLN